MIATDVDRLDEAIDFVRANDTGDVLAKLMPLFGEAEHGAVTAGCTFQHAALMLFPPTIEDFCEEVRKRGFDADDLKPSVVVRERLSRRYSVPVHALEVVILRIPVAESDGKRREVEIFALAVPPNSDLEAIAEGEREHDDEVHLALRVDTTDRVFIHALRSMLVDGGRMRADGGGYNRREGATVLYFRDVAASSPLYRRLELSIDGQHAQIVDAHCRQSEPPANRLLDLMTGAWRTQAIAVAADLSLANHLADNAGLTVDELAQLTGTDRDSLDRLVRFLASLGVVKATSGRLELTEVGRLLRSDVGGSLRPLALLYGGPFYESFGHLGHSVRTGDEAFTKLFGSHHLAYFAAQPALARLFDDSMASSATRFGAIAEAVDFSLADVVVDVGGGNGRLLTRLLRAAPNLRGVLFDRPHAIEAGRAAMLEAGCADRCDFVAGDFTASVPTGGDIYLLSRILHDWDDERCGEILRRCAEAMSAHAALLVIERLLPEDGAPSLAFAWDVHMLCNVGGRERTTSQFAELLGRAGFTIMASHELPLDFFVLYASKTPA